MNEQLTAHYLVNRYPQKVKILFNCGHDGKKGKHHPDYKKPFEIELLCHKCHGKHIKDRKLEKRIEAPVDYISKPLFVDLEKMERERERLGLTKAEIERRAKLKGSTYSKIIARRTTTISTLNRIADALYLDPKDLLTT